MAKKVTIKYSRNDIRYWEKRVYQPVFREGDGGLKMNGNYHVRIQAHGERRGVSLKATSVRPAAKLAKELDGMVRHHGWEKGLKLFRGEAPVPKITLTLGEYLAELGACGEIKPRTLRTYTTKVRTIAAFLNPPEMPDKLIETGSHTKRRKSCTSKKLSKYDYVNGGAAAWQQLVDATPLRFFTLENLTNWRKTYLSKHKENPKKLTSSTRSANSCIRAGKAIFANDVRDKLPHVKLPDPIPFETIGLLKEAGNKYRSEITNPEKLLTEGSLELAMATTQTEIQAAWLIAGKTGDPVSTPARRTRAELSVFRKNEAFKALVLGLCAGLRRGEIDSLRWSQVDFSSNCIWIETTETHDVKSDSVGNIPLDPQIMNLFRKWKSDATDEFVIRGCAPSSSTDKTRYRANRSYKELIKWLNSKGLTARMAIHALRKEFGSIICAQAGIHAASRLLRHANISMTADVYTDHRTNVTAGLGSSLSMNSRK